MGNRLPDYLAPGLDLVLVGINPGLRSAALGHHFAGRGNKFWDLLYQSGLVPRKMSYEDDARLLELGIGITNLVDLASRGSSDLGPDDYRKGSRILIEKLEKYRPRLAACVGATVFRELWLALTEDRVRGRIICGPRREKLGGSELYVLPNPSGRNAHYSHAEMLREWRRLARRIEKQRA